MKIQLLSFSDCPNAGAARTALEVALRAETLDSAVEEIDIGHADAPGWARAWGSPTILIDGEDVTGVSPRSGDLGCRLYGGGAPSVGQIRERLRIAIGTSPSPRESCCAEAELGDRR